MNWHVNEGRIEADSAHHDKGTPLLWWIIENTRGCTLHASKELMREPLTFRRVTDAMIFAETKDRQR